MSLLSCRCLRFIEDGRRRRIRSVIAAALTTSIDSNVLPPSHFLTSRTTSLRSRRRCCYPLATTCTSSTVVLISNAGDKYFSTGTPKHYQQQQPPPRKSSKTVRAISELTERSNSSFHVKVYKSDGDNDDDAGGSNGDMYGHGGKSHHVTSLLARMKQQAKILIENLLPDGYPDAVHSSYAHYSLWHITGLACSSASGVLATQTLLFAVGLGAASFPMAAALNWVIKDGLGQLGGVAFSAMVNTRFDSNPKMWQVLAAVSIDMAMFMELMSPFFPGHFLVIASVANVGKNIAYLSASASKAAVNQSMAIRKNLADVTAKCASQGIVASMIGTGVGIAFAKYLGSNITAIIPVAMILSITHITCTCKAVERIGYATIDTQRFDILWDHRCVGYVPRMLDQGGYGGGGGGGGRSRFSNRQRSLNSNSSSRCSSSGSRGMSSSCAGVAADDVTDMISCYSSGDGGGGGDSGGGGGSQSRSSYGGGGDGHKTMSEPEVVVAVLSPEQVGLKEKYMTYSIKNGRRLGWDPKPTIEMGCSVEAALTNMEELQTLVDVMDGEEYLMAVRVDEERRWACLNVVLLDSCSPADVLKAMHHARLARRLLVAQGYVRRPSWLQSFINGTDRSSTTAATATIITSSSSSSSPSPLAPSVAAPFGRLDLETVSRSLAMLRSPTEFAPFLDALREQGWCTEVLFVENTPLRRTTLIFND